jgi:hypothetical protein
MQEPAVQITINQFLQSLIALEGDLTPILRLLSMDRPDLVGLDAHSRETLFSLRGKGFLQAAYIKHDNYNHSQLVEALCKFYRSTSDCIRRSEVTSSPTGLYNYLLKAATAASELWAPNVDKIHQENLKQAAKVIEDLVNQFSATQQSAPVSTI